MRVDPRDMRGESDMRVRDRRDLRDERSRVTLVTHVASPRVTHDPLVSRVNLFKQLGEESK